MGLIWTLIKLIIILGVVATIHEFGHFIFAKLFKMKVDEFAIGFGKKIFSKKYKGTVFSLRWIPLGGFCAIEGEDGKSEENDSFCKKPWWQRIIVLIAGATFNAILAIVVLISINLTGVTYTNKIDKISETSLAYKMGLRQGDKILDINGKKMRILQDIYSYMDTSKQKTIITYERDNKEYKISTTEAVYEIGYIGVYFKTNDNGIATNEINIVEGSGAAEKSGIRANDKITSINGKETTNAKDVIKIVSESPNKKLNVEIERDGKTIAKTVKPSLKKTFDIGTIITEKVDTNIYYAYCRTLNSVDQIIGSYVNLFKGNVSVNQLSGIVGIGEVVSKTEGFLDFLNLLAVISLAIGIANVMPFPPLDGGKIVLVLCEAITRKKVSPRVEEVLSLVGFGILIALTLYVTYNDITRLI